MFAAFRSASALDRVLKCFLVQSPIGSLFDARSLLTDVSGAGNNWAHGHHHYGPQYGDSIMDLFRMEAEQCDSLQGALLLHSLGGGTGSGLGSYLLGKLEVCMVATLLMCLTTSCTLLALCPSGL